MKTESPWAFLILLSVLAACEPPRVKTQALEANEPFAPSVEALEWVDLEAMGVGIVLDLRYGTADNFTHEVLYPKPRALMRRAAAEALAEVQQELRAQGLGLKVWDAYRPLPVQQKMWDLIQDERYVSNPAANKGRHTRGTAVDVTLVDGEGKELPLPTAFDDFSERAHSEYDGAELTEEQKKNRALLREVMEKHGFKVLPTEWWHFDFKEWEAYPPSGENFGEILTTRRRG